MRKKPEIKYTAGWLETLIKDFINQSPENTLKNPANDKAWDDPLVGFSSGDDPIYETFKEHVGLFHWTPLELFNLTFPQIKAVAGELTVISWVLPQTARTKADHKKETTYPSESWARARKFGEEAIETVVAAIEGEPDAVASESADVIYHWLVLLTAAGVSLDDVAAKLEMREGRSGIAEKASRAKS